MSDITSKKKRGKPAKATSEVAGASKEVKKGKVAPEKLAGEDASDDEPVSPVVKVPARKTAVSKNKALVATKDNKDSSEGQMEDTENVELVEAPVKKGRGRKNQAAKGKVAEAKESEADSGGQIEGSEEGEARPTKKGRGRKNEASNGKAPDAKDSEPAVDEPFEETENDEASVDKGKKRKNTAPKGKGPAAKKKIILHVEDLEKKHFSLEVYSTETVAEIKEKLEDYVNLDAEDQNLTVKTICQNDLPISHYVEDNGDHAYLSLCADMTVFINDVPVEANKKDRLYDLQERFVEVSNFDQYRSRYCYLMRDGKQLDEEGETVGECGIQPFEHLTFEE